MLFYDWVMSVKTRSKLIISSNIMFFLMADDNDVDCVKIFL